MSHETAIIPAVINLLNNLYKGEQFEDFDDTYYVDELRINVGVDHISEYVSFEIHNNGKYSISGSFPFQSKKVSNTSRVGKVFGIYCWTAQMFHGKIYPWRNDDFEEALMTFVLKYS